MILLLHSLIEAAIGLLFLFHPSPGDLIPGFSDGSGAAFALLLGMYGLAALLLAALSLYAYLHREQDAVYLPVTLGLSLFHYGMLAVQLLYNPDPRAALLHFLLAIFLTGRYLQRRGKYWERA